MAISPASRESKKEEPARPFPMEKCDLRPRDVTSSSAPRETKKEEAERLPPIGKKERDPRARYVAISPASRESKKEEPARPFPIEKCDLRQENVTSSSAPRETKKEDAPPIGKKQIEQGKSIAHQIMERRRHCKKLIEDSKAHTKKQGASIAHQKTGPEQYSSSKPKRVHGSERFWQLLEPNRVPIYMFAESRIVNQILGRDPRNQFTRAAFEYEGFDPHPSAKGYRRTGCITFPDTSIPTDQNEYLFERTFTLGELLEGMDYVHQQIVLRTEVNRKANVNSLWRFIDARIEICRLIKKQIASAGASSQEIPAYMIR